MDYGLIFGALGFPEMGITGVAWATVESWVFVILGMFYLLLKDKLVTVNLKNTLGQFSNTLKEIGTLGLPTILTQIIGPITLMYLTFLFAKQSVTSVAAFGVASRIETLLLIGILGVSTVITPFIAQNKGAKLQDRINESIAFGGRASTYLGLLVCVLLFLTIKPIAHIFSEDTSVVASTANYFYIVSASYIFYGLFVITSSIFNGLQLPLNSMKLMLLKSVLFTIPFTLIGSYFGVEAIYIGNIAAGFLASY